MHRERLANDGRGRGRRAAAPLALGLGIALPLAAGSAAAGQAAFFDGFEDYTCGELLEPQSPWEPWDDQSVGADQALVVCGESGDPPAYEGTQCLAMIGDDFGGGDAEDLVRRFAEVSGGVWRVSLRQYIPGTSSGYVYAILLNTYESGGAKNWSVQLQMNIDSSRVYSEPENTWLPLIKDEWVAIEVEIDFDQNTQVIRYGGAVLDTKEWTNDGLMELQAINLYGDTCETWHYYDALNVAPGAVPVAGACCVDGGTCVSAPPEMCAAVGGSFQAEGTTCATSPCSPCAGDLDDDGSVGFQDLLVLLGGWGPCPTSGGGANPGWFTHLTAEEYVGEGWAEHGYAGLTTYRVYANFSEILGSVWQVYTYDTLPPLRISASTGAFHNDTVHDSLTAPVDLTGSGYWSNQWDTYVTIGTDDAEGDLTELSSQFGPETDWLQSSFETNDAWWQCPFDDQAFADPDRRVLIAQLVVPEGAWVEGSLNLREQDSFSYYGVPFDSLPSPCSGNLDGDGEVGFSDLLQLLAAWGDCAP